MAEYRLSDALVANLAVWASDAIPTTLEVEALACEVQESRAEIERLRAAANRTLNAFFCCEGLDNTDLMDAFSEWAVLMGHAAVPEAAAWIAKWEARRG